MVSGVTVRVDTDCGGVERCQIYEARGYYRTTLDINNVNIPNGTFAADPTEVLALDVNHSFTLLPKTYEAIFIKYPENYNTVMPFSCT
jgi:hypothetical protein